VSSLLIHTSRRRPWDKLFRRRGLREVRGFVTQGSLALSRVREAGADSLG